MKKALIISFVVLILLCGVGGLYMSKMQAAKMAAMAGQSKPYTVAKGDVVASVVDTGTIDAVNSVEVKSRVSGRLSKLLIEEGDFVTQGQVIGLIDPQETQFQVAQNQAQLAGAQSGAARTAVEIRQRRVTAQADFQQANSRLRRLEMETRAQPTLTNAAIQEATAAYNRSLKDRENLIKITQPNARSRALTTQRDAQVNYENAKREQERQARLLAQGYVASREAETAKLALDVAKLKLDQASDELSRIDSEFSLQQAQANEAVRSSEAAMRRATVNSIQDKVKQEEYRQAVADVAKARAALSDVEALQRSRDQNLATVSQLASVLKDSQRQLRETEIRSPITGVVTKKMLKEGELATGLSGFSAGTPIVRIEDRTSLRVLLNVNEIDVAKMANGMSASVTVDAFANETFKGTVFRIAPTSVEAQPGQASTDSVVKYEVELRLDTNDKRLRSGMSAKCTLEVSRKNDVVVVPKMYVAKEAKGYFVYLAPPPGTPTPPPGPDGKPAPVGTKKEVKVGVEGAAQYEVVSGVNVGDKLVAPPYSGPDRKGMMQMGPDDQ